MATPYIQASIFEGLLIRALAIQSLASYHIYTGFAGQEYKLPPPTGCNCPGSTLVFECTTTSVREATTIWKGSLLTDCLETSNTIVLHHQEVEQKNVYGECNNGAVTATLHHVVNSSLYTSSLQINITHSMYGNSVICVHAFDDGEYPTVVGIEKIKGMCQECIRSLLTY